MFERIKFPCQRQDTDPHPFAYASHPACDPVGCCSLNLIGITFLCVGWWVAVKSPRWDLQLIDPAGIGQLGLNGLGRIVSVQCDHKWPTFAASSN